MRVVDGLQSAIMYRTGKQLNGRAKVFVFYPLIIVYVASTTWLLAAEAAQASASQRDVKDAEQIVGRFLRNEAGSKWLAGLAKTRSTPLTTRDLVKELLKVTRPNGRVWQAASILGDSFDEQNRMGITTQPILAQAENWKDIVEHIEEQDDIICLYRKSTEETAKKSDDWKKFLRSVTPGYTVHLAIDTGRKYVICLKKIEVPETTPAEVSSTSKIPATSEVSPIVTSTQPSSSMTPGKLGKIPEGILRIPENKNMSRVKLDDIDESCRDADGSEDCENDSRSRDYLKDEVVTADKVFGYGSEGSSEEEAEKNTPKRGMGVELDPPSAKRRKSYLADDDSLLEKKPGKMSPESSHDPECNRPIILVMQNGNDPGHQPGRLPGISAQRNFEAAKLPWVPLAPGPSARIPMPHPPPMLPMMNDMPRYGPNHYFMPPPKFQQPPKPHPPPMLPMMNDMPRYGLNHYFMPPPEFRQPPTLDNLHKAGQPRQVFSHNSQTSYHIPSGKMQQPVVKFNSQMDVHILQRPLRTMAKPVVQKKAFVRQPSGMKPRRPESYQRNPYFGGSKRYPFGRYLPKRNRGHPGPILGPNSANHRPAGSIRWKVPVRKTPLPRRRTPNEANMGQNIRQFLRKYKYPQSSRATSVYESGIQRFSGQRPANLTTGKSIPIRNNIGAPKRRPRLSFPEISQNNPSMDHSSKQNPLVKSNFDKQRPNFVFDPDYPTPIQLVRPFRPSIPWKPPCAANRIHPILKCSNPLVCSLIGNPFQLNSSIPCQSPCDRPVKLQIVINGKVQEPLKVSVIRQPGQRVEIVGPGNSTMPYGSRALRKETPIVRALGDAEKNVESKLLEVKGRMFEPEEDKQYLDDKKTGNQTEKENKLNDTVSLGGSTTDISVKLGEKHNSTVELRIKATTESIKDVEIGNRFLHEGTTEKNSKVTSDTLANTTLSTTTNSSIIE